MQKYLLVVASIFGSIHPFPGAILVGKTYPNMKRAPVLYNKVLEKQVREQNRFILYPCAQARDGTPAQPSLPMPKPRLPTAMSLLFPPQEWLVLNGLLLG